ncbi:MAG TPA: type II toxin-antitoxin system VapC family toxin [Aggregatilinea sp.]|jgi:PIN domain nuclease of toxin-antitoxin system|uniref:type II toxin-antitoxin system VapC family toxin n=1 Tax=Aggregatilinea sp. TaxID=2806333 RepID=UPI002BCAE51D|nr:type II toxin-antitoxin system VapC family toxin [Aggregatilinea sp.]HML24482.1 type II toxin-antitoxin system VapC family toxin [Aggregatilinea sp.]
MNYLLDTHAFLWFISADPSLSPAAQAAIESEENRIFLSTASLWEMAIKVSLGKLEVPSPFGQFMYEQMRENDVTLHGIQLAHIDKVVTLPFHHRDPFDRLIVAQSLTDQLPVIGKDPVFDAYGIQRVW